MTEDPRDILRRTLYIDQDIQRLQAEQRQLEDRLTCLQGFDYSKPVVQGSGNRGSLETLAAEAADLQDRIARRITALIQAKREAFRIICLLPAGPERSVMEERYILLRDWRSAAEDLGYSYRHVIRLHGEAIKHLRERCP